MPVLRQAVPADASLIDPEVHVESFRQAREARRLELVEDYVELIADLIGDGGEARQVDIAARLGVAQPTVAQLRQRLAEDGFVPHRPYRGRDAEGSEHHVSGETLDAFRRFAERLSGA